MKQALVLGFALAANAMTAEQVDNELIVVPTGGKLGDLAKFPTKMGRVMFDEQADDELLIRPIVAADDDEFIAMLLPREHFKTEEEYQKYVARMRFHRDDEELFVAPEGRLGELAKKYPGRIMFDEADDELLAMKPREESKHDIYLKNHPELRPQYYTGLYFKAAAAAADDDELMAVLPRREHFKTEEEYQRVIAKARFHLDDELFVAPQGKLADLAKKYPGMIMFDEQADDELFGMKRPREESKMTEEYRRHLAKQYGLANFDEQADDELLVRPTAADDDEFMVRLLPRESFQTEEEYQKYLAKWRFQRDDEELFVAPQGKLADLAKKYPGKIMFDEADDELFGMKRPREESKTTEEYRKQLAKKYGLTSFDDVADDELLIRPLVNADDDEFIAMLLPREHFKTEEEYQKYVAKMRFHRDDEELFVAPEGRLGELAKKYPGKIMFDEADDELFVAPQGKLADLAKKYPGMIMFDEQADDELIAMIPPRDKFKSEEEYQRFIARIKNTGSRDDADDELRAIDNLPRDEFGRIVRPPYARFDEVADDELSLLPVRPKVFSDKGLFKSAKIATSEAWVRGDDEADDELAYLGQLIKDGWIPRIYADDELRAEKPSHVKAQEKAQMKTELPKMKRKLRPADETAFLA